MIREIRKQNEETHGNEIQAKKGKVHFDCKVGVIVMG